jgi:hypothetical protein
MPDGLYQIQYEGAQGQGTGVVLLTNGKILGSDGGVDYDGTYVLRPPNNIVSARIKCTVHPGIELVTGFPARETIYDFSIAAEFPAQGSNTVLVYGPDGAPIVVSINCLRPI